MKQAMCIVVFGLPGSGKSFFARTLAKAINAAYLNTDIIRKELFEDRRYTPGEKQQVYKVMLDRARKELQAHTNVILDGTFFTGTLRKPVEDLAEDLGVRLAWIEILAREDIIRKRMQQSRKFSEADFDVYLKIRDAFEPLEADHLALASTNANLDVMLNSALAYLRFQYGLTTD